MIPALQRIPSGAINKVLVIGLIGLVAGMVAIVNSKHSTEQDGVRFAFPYTRPASSYEPTRIELAPEYTFLEHVFSPLVEISPKGELQPGVAERFEWIGDEAHFTLRSDLRTIDGWPITADDAAFSLKRVMVRTGNTHGNLNDLLCYGKTLKTPDDPCPGMRVDGNRLILKPRGRRPFFMPMLAAIDFAIFPRKAIDPASLDIRDYRNTSGTYYVSSDDGKGGIRLQANPRHFHYSKEMPQSIELVHAPTSGDSVRAFREDKVDFVSTDSAVAEDIITLGRNAGDAVLQKTMNIRTYGLFFTDQGMERLSTEQRLSVGIAVRSVLTKYFRDSSPEFEPSIQFFPAFGEGGLTPEQVNLLKKRFEAIKPATTGKGLSVGLVRLGEAAQFQKILAPVLPGIRVRNLQTVPAFMDPKKDEIPDMYLSGPDTGFLEDIGLISYYMSAGQFGMTPEARQQWMDHYSETESKQDRVTMLRELHLKSLLEPRMIPIAMGPYVSVVRKSWKPLFSQFYSNTQLWLMRRE